MSGTDGAKAPTAGAPKYNTTELIEMLDAVYGCSDCSVCKGIVEEILEQMRAGQGGPTGSPDRGVAPGTSPPPVEGERK